LILKGSFYLIFLFQTGYFRDILATEHEKTLILQVLRIARLHTGGPMKKSFLLHSAILGLTLLIAGCQTVGPHLGTGFVAPDNRIMITSGQGSGSWQGRDLTVDYRYSVNQRDMDFSGMVHFASGMTYNFILLSDFQLSVVFFDESGKVTEKRGLATNRGNFDPMPFHNRVVLPPGTAGMAFAYQGTAFESGDSEGGGAGPTYFWHYPVN
jgi:hypothetical protein